MVWDEVILLVLVRLQEQGPEAIIRRIEVEGGDGETVVFRTNHLKLSAAAYRERWQIELLLKRMRQALWIKTQAGASTSAVLSQVWTGLLAMLLVKCLHMRSRHGRSLSNLVALLRQQLCLPGLPAPAGPPFEPPPQPPAVQQPAFGMT